MPASPSQKDQGKAEEEAAQQALQAEDGIIRSPSLMTMARDISGDLSKLSGSKEEAAEYFKNIDPKNYKKREWTAEMERAHKEYHDLADNVGPPHRAFQQARQSTPRSATWDQHVERAKVAIKWGQRVVKAAEARLTFWKSYRDAYAYDQVQGHIDEIKGQIVNGRKAVHEARLNCGKAYETVLRDQGQGYPDAFR